VRSLSGGSSAAKLKAKAGPKVKAADVGPMIEKNAASAGSKTAGAEVGSGAKTKRVVELRPHHTVEVGSSFAWFVFSWFDLLLQKLCNWPERAVERPKHAQRSGSGRSPGLVMRYPDSRVARPFVAARFDVDDVCYFSIVASS
jgi:hypothetical protein